ncbi:MAG: hypothetical protein ACRDPG_09395, partial [Nocardioidaceae bacterium]
LSSPDLAAAAKELNASPDRRSPLAGRCTRPAGTGTDSLITWNGRLAVLVVEPASRTASVHACHAPGRVLHSTSY